MAAQILIVEDESILALELAQSLQDFGYDVCAVTDKGEEALVLSNQYKPDLILMDLNLRGSLSGIEATKLIRQSQDVAIIYLTGNGDITNQAKLTQPNAYILKPYAEKELQNTLEIVLYNHQAELKEKALQVQLERNRRLESLGSLAGGIAHDFNNVLAAIIGNLELALLNFDSSPISKQFVENALDSTNRA